jgi:hypothetical protein
MNVCIFTCMYHIDTKKEGDHTDPLLIAIIHTHLHTYTLTFANTHVQAGSESASPQTRTPRAIGQNLFDDDFDHVARGQDHALEEAWEDDVQGTVSAERMHRNGDNNSLSVYDLVSATRQAHPAAGTHDHHSIAEHGVDAESMLLMMSGIDDRHGDVGPRSGGASPRDAQHTHKTSQGSASKPKLDCRLELEEERQALSTDDDDLMFLNSNRDFARFKYGPGTAHDNYPTVGHENRTPSPQTSHLDYDEDGQALGVQGGRNVPIVDIFGAASSQPGSEHSPSQ